MNRNTVALLIGILVIGIAVLGILLWQKMGDLDEIQSQLQKSRQSTATLQTQLDESQRRVTSLQTQLTQSEKHVAALQTQLAESQQNAQALGAQLRQAEETVVALRAELDDLKSPPLTPSEPVILTGGLWSGGTLSFPIELKRFEKVQGEVIGGFPDLLFYIQDPAGGKVQDFGRIRQTNFMFTAQMDGRYTVVITNPSGLYNTSYTLRYTIYRK